MSDATGKDTTDAEEAGENSATKAKGRREKELNEQAAEHQAEEKRAEQEAEALEQEDKPEQPTDPNQLRGEIAEAREELGEEPSVCSAGYRNDRREDHQPPRRRGPQDLRSHIGCDRERECAAADAHRPRGRCGARDRRR